MRIDDDDSMSGGSDSDSDSDEDEELKQDLTHIKLKGQKFIWHNV